MEKITIELRRDTADALLTAVKYELIDARQRRCNMLRIAKLEKVTPDVSATDLTIWHLKAVVGALGEAGIVS